MIHDETPKQLRRRAEGLAYMADRPDFNKPEDLALATWQTAHASTLLALADLREREVGNHEY